MANAPRDQAPEQDVLMPMYIIFPTLEGNITVCPLDSIWMNRLRINRAVLKVRSTNGATRDVRFCLAVLEMSPIIIGMQEGSRRLRNPKREKKIMLNPESRMDNSAILNDDMEKLSQQARNPMRMQDILAGMERPKFFPYLAL